MKRIILAIALVASLQTAFAQTNVKSVGAAKAAVVKAVAASENPKQNTKTATWIKLGKAYMDAYNAPQGNGWIGASRSELALLLGDDRPSSSEYAELGGQTMIKDVYATRNYYFNEAEILQLIEVTAPIYPDCLEQALAAYQKALALDEKGSKKKDLTLAIQTIAAKFVDEAYNAYTFNNLELASYYFEMAVAASESEPYAKVDTNSVYNAGLTAWMLGQSDKAKTYLEKSIAPGYYGDEGDAYAKLADIADKSGDKALCQSYLEEAFTKFPQSQSILVGLINYYINSGENTNRLFELIGAAKANEPNNASLYYVEGNIHLQLGQEEEAIASYRQCNEINPDYEFGFIGEGQYWYNKAIDLQDKASAELDDKKYNALIEEFETALKNCIPPFESAYEISQDPGIKVAVCEYLKNACYRFSYDSKLYEEKYNKYNKIVSDAKQQ